MCDRGWKHVGEGQSSGSEAVAINILVSMTSRTSNCDITQTEKGGSMIPPTLGQVLFSVEDGLGLHGAAVKEK